jgi:hypothetical protein
MNTLRSGQDTMVKNELNNIARAMKDGSISHLENRGQGLSAVVLGAGPSLPTYARLLADHLGEALYASPFQVLPVLQRHGLKPHLCFAIDYTEGLKAVYEHLDKKWVKDIPLIYSCKVAPDIIDAYPGPTLPIWTAGGVGTHLWGGRALILDSGRNVGIALTRFLKWCGVSQMLLVGFDFAWSGETTHAPGHPASGQIFCFNPRHHIQMKNKNGEIIFSTSVFLTALRTLEAELKETKAKVFNLYGGNAVIDGAETVTWDDVLSRGLLQSETGSLERFLRHLCQNPSPWPLPASEVRSLHWSDSLRSAQRRLERLFKKANRNQNEIHTALNQLLIFLNQDPLCRPYLLNEVRNLAGLVFVKPSYGIKELVQCKQIIKQTLRKVREMDRKLSALQSVRLPIFGVDNFPGGHIYNEKKQKYQSEIVPDGSAVFRFVCGGSE